jgi:hypothetical protein
VQTRIECRKLYRNLQRINALSELGDRMNFIIVITKVDGVGLSHTVTAQITNTRSADVHNAWAKAEVFSKGQRILISGQTYLKEILGIVKAGTTITAQATLSFSLFDGLTILQNGAQVLLGVHCDECSETLTYEYKP